MQMIHQIWVNWIEKPENSIFIPYFFEWDTNDIEVYENIPVFRVSDTMYNVFLTQNDFIIPSVFLQNSLNKAYYVTGDSREFVKHCFIIVNPSFNSLAICTKDSNFPILKSRLLYRHETIVKNIIMTSGLPQTEVEENFFINLPTEEKESIFNVSFYGGLNQKEMKVKKNLLLTLKQLKYDDKREALAFLLSECSSFLYKDSLSKDTKEIYTLLLNQLESGWSEKHQNILEYTYKWLH
ncbi:hypothetical protein CN918_32515 [Priestia megaterium]|nr:hypothetical protein CN918_32515 [Priestia megaterium]